MKNVRTALLTILVLLIIAVAASVLSTNAAPIAAAPLADYLGAEPLYDSGWFLTPASQPQTLDHELGAHPTLVTIYVADDDSGTYPSLAFDNVDTGESWYGASVRDVNCHTLKIYWHELGIGYNHSQSKWYQRGTDYGRVLIFAASEGFGLPPCRP